MANQKKKTKKKVDDKVFDEWMKRHQDKNGMLL